MTGDFWIDGGILVVLITTNGISLKAAYKANNIAKKYDGIAGKVDAIEKNGSAPVREFIAEFREWQKGMEKWNSDQSDRLDTITEAFSEMVKMMQGMFKELPCSTHGERLAFLEATQKGKDDK